MLHELPASLPAQVQLLRFARVRGWSRAARRLVWAPALALVVLLLQSAFWADRVPVVLKIGIAAVAILAARRPADALLFVAGLVPFGHVVVTSIWPIHPLALSEALVLAFLAGYLWRNRRAVTEGTSPTDGLTSPSRLFALVVVASCLIQLTVLQVWHNYPLAYAKDFLYFLAREYLTSVPDQRPWVDGRNFVSTAALLLEGVALLLCVRSLSREQPAFARRLTRVIVVAATGVASLSFFQVTAEGLSSNQSVTSVIEAERWSFAIPSVNTAGFYFMLVAFISLGTAFASRRHLVPGLLAAALMIGGVWLTNTRGAIVAGLATVGAGAVWMAVARLRWLSLLRVALVALVVALAVGVFVILYNPFRILDPTGGTQGSPSLSLHLRVLFAQTALRMLSTVPLFGVGVGQYRLRYPEFSSPELLSYFARNDAHNYYLWVGAELGLVGLAIFLWLLGAALLHAWSRLRARPTDLWFFGMLAGMVAFLLTCLSGQPFAIPQVAYTFWMVVGAAVGVAVVPPAEVAPALGGRELSTTGGEDRETQSRKCEGSSGPQRIANAAVAIAALVIIGSVPVRAARALDEIDLSRVTYGLYDWETSSTGIRYRWTGPRATFFEGSSVREIEVPIAARDGVAAQGFTVDVLVDGRVLRRITLADGAWRSVRVAAPHSSSTRRFWRVDLHVSPTWVPRFVLPDSSDDRELGILVGEIGLTNR